MGRPKDAEWLWALRICKTSSGLCPSFHVHALQEMGNYSHKKPLSQALIASSWITRRGFYWQRLSVLWSPLVLLHPSCPWSFTIFSTCILWLLFLHLTLPSFIQIWVWDLMGSVNSCCPFCVDFLHRSLLSTQPMIFRPIISFSLTVSNFTTWKEKWVGFKK